MKLLVCGSRTIKDENYIYKCIGDAINKLKYQVFTIIEGNANGVDKIAGKYAKENGIDVDDFKPNWKRYGKGAGKIRSKEMVDLCDKGIAIWDGISIGTEYTIMQLRKQGKLLKIYCEGWTS